MSTETTADGLALLGEAVRARREQQGLPIDLSARGGPSEMTVRKIEIGAGGDGLDLSIRPMTKRRLEDALAWPRGWVDAILTGEVQTVEKAIAPISMRATGRKEADPREPVLGAISAAEFSVRQLAQADAVDTSTADAAAGHLRQAWQVLADAPPTR